MLEPELDYLSAPMWGLWLQVLGAAPGRCWQRKPQGGRQKLVGKGLGGDCSRSIGVMGFGEPDRPLLGVSRVLSTLFHEWG